MDTTIALFGILCVLVGYQIRLAIQKFEEKASYKEIIFKEKINMYREIFEGINHLMVADTREVNSVIKELKKLANILFIYASVIPSSVYSNSSDHITKMFTICDKNNIEEITEEISKRVLSLRRSIISESRQDLGIKKLSEETEKLFVENIGIYSKIFK